MPAVQWRRRVAFVLLASGWRRAVELNLAVQCLALTAQQILCTAPLLVAFSAANRHDPDQSVGNVLARYLALSPAASRDVTGLFSDSGAS